MKGWKEEKEKSGSGGPMFPRLHVNDTEKGGPRAPPRNKMALYEQLSFPSHRFSSTASTMPLPVRQNPHNQGNRHDRNPFSPFQAPPSTSGYSTGKVNSRSSNIENMETTKMELERRFTKNVEFKSAKAATSVAECSSFHLRDSSAKNSCRKRVDDNDEDFRVPTLINSEKLSCLNKDTTGTKNKRLSAFRAKCLQNGFSYGFNSLERPLEQGNTSNVKLINPERSRNEQNVNDAVATNEHRENSLSRPEVCKKLVSPSKFSKSSLNRENSTTRNVSEQKHKESCGHLSTSDRDMRSEDTLRMRHDSHVEASPGNIHSNPEVTDNCNQDNDDMEDGQPELQNDDKSDNVSETSMTESISGFEISPDDVVGVIGPKQFWKVRRAIVNQQRVFALQVFDLHRLLQVQKLLASSPCLLLEDKPYTIPQKAPIKNLMIESDPKSHSTTVKQTLDPQKPNQNTECRKENTVAHSRPARSEGLNEGDIQPPRHDGYFSGNPPPLSSAPEHRSNPWCFQPPMNQWLVPVMSPSEGLIYKPFSSPCPPVAGFMTPLYGNYNPAASNYLPTPYVMNPIVCSPLFEGARHNGHTKQNSRSSCNMSFPKSDALIARPRDIHASRDSERQGSTASSPSGRTQGRRDVLSLFPMAPPAEDSLRPSEEERQTRAIRVVPHNARSATESAARIFRSIQEERRQN